MKENLQDIEYERFLKAATYHAEKKGVGEIAFLYQCKPAYIYMILNGNKLAGRKTQLKFARACGFNTTTGLIESVCKQIQPKPAPPCTNKIVKFKSEMQRKHFDVIQTFEDAETALHFNEFLSKLEKLDVAKYEEIYGKVRGYVKEIERKELVQSDASGEAKKKDKKGA